MKHSSKILLVGLLSSLALILGCLYMNVEKFTNESSDQLIEVASSDVPSNHLKEASIEASSQQQTTTEKRENAFDGSSRYSDDAPQKISWLLYQIDERNITIDGRLPIMEESDRLKRAMVGACGHFSCDRKVHFSPERRDPSWRALAIDLIKLFHEEKLHKAMFRVKDKSIEVEAHFEDNVAKARLDQLLADYDTLYAINDSSLVVTAPVVPTTKKREPVASSLSNATKSVKVVTTASSQGNSSIAVAKEILRNASPKSTQPSYLEIAKAQEQVSKLLKKSPINFHRNRAQITKQGRKTLNRVIKILKGLSHVRIEVHGYTDAGGRAKINQWISEERAKSVKKYLEQHGIDAHKITAKGFGERHLLFPNDPYNVLNRRVEIVIKKEKR